MHLGVLVATTSIALEILGHGDGLPVGARASGVDHAGVWSGTVRVDLVDSHHDLATSRHLRKSAAVHLHDCSGSSLDVVVTSTKSLTAGSSGIAAEASGVLLEGVAASAVTRSGWVDTDGRTLATSITGSTNDSAVASHKRRGSQKAEGNNGGFGEVHSEPVR